MKSSAIKLAMMMCNEEKHIPEEYTKRSRRKQQTREIKYGGINKAMENREGQGIRGTDYCNQRARCLSI